VEKEWGMGLCQYFFLVDWALLHEPTGHRTGGRVLWEKEWDYQRFFSDRLNLIVAVCWWEEGVGAAM
jgi:hypothetical protein